MVQAGQSLGLAIEAGERLGILLPLRREHLHDDVPQRVGLARQIHETHATATDEAIDAELATAVLAENALTDQWIGGGIARFDRGLHDGRGTECALAHARLSAHELGLSLNGWCFKLRRLRASCGSRIRTPFRAPHRCERRRSMACA
jgi:hypothetical protein